MGVKALRKRFFVHRFETQPDVEWIATVIGMETRTSHRIDAVSELRVRPNAHPRLVIHPAALRSVHVTRRFVLTHAIAHLLNDAIPGKGEVFREPHFDASPRATREHRANRIAASFLMPAWQVRVLGREMATYAPNELAPAFAVSPTTMKYRLQAIGIL